MLTDEDRGAGGGGGAKSCDSEKARTSINQSILSEYIYNTVCAIYNIVSLIP
jgi:hypothetical protein